MFRLAAAIALLSCSALLAKAATNGSMTGRVTDASGGAIPGVRVTATNAATGAKAQATTGADGTYTLSALPSGTYTLSATKGGFLTFTQKGILVAGGQSLTRNITLKIPGLVQSIVVSAKAPTTSVTSVSLPKGQLQAVAGPIGGAAQALSAAPGVNVSGYGGIAATARTEVVVRGIKTGWSSVNGDIEKNGVTFLLDGIPMNNLIAANGHWESSEVPIMPLISEVHVIYGPADPATRWYDSVGGTVNYVPVQPSEEPGLSFSTGMSFGSYSTYSPYLILNTGMWKGWSATLAGGYTHNHTFRTNGWDAPGQAWAGYGKVRHEFEHGDGDFSVGYYAGYEYDYRPNFIPAEPINQDGQAITTLGVLGVSPNVPANAPLYSQATTGFYSSLNGNLWLKLIRVNSHIVYSKFSHSLGRHATLYENMWYRHGYRLHWRVDNFFGPGITKEWYPPTSDTYGNQAYVNWDLPHNEVSLGGWFIHGDYNSLVSLWGTPGTSEQNPDLFSSQYLYNNYSQFYLQDRISLAHNLFITPGVAEQIFQTHYFNAGFADFPEANPQTAVNFIQAPPAHKRFARFSPSVGLGYTAFHRLHFHSNYAETYQNPIDVAFGKDAPPGGVDLSTLQPVKSQDVEAGVRADICEGGLLGHCSLDSTYFHDKLTNETIKTTFANFAQVLIAKFSFGSGVYNGVALNFDDVPSWHLQIHANATFQHDYFTDYIPPGTTTQFGGFTIPNTPSMTTNLGVSYHFNAGKKALVTPELWWQYIGKRYIFSNVTLGPTRQTMPGYGLVNLTFASTLSQLGRPLHNVPVQVQFGVYNLFNTEYNPVAYISSGGYFSTSFGNYLLVDPGAPREYAVSIHYGF